VNADIAKLRAALDGLGRAIFAPIEALLRDIAAGFEAACNWRPRR
jgi:hypothetical protein